MSGCCSPTDYRRLFSRKQAARDLRSFRKKGLGGTSQQVVELAGDVRGATVLEVGGGIGAIELALLERGAAHATNVELSGGYEDAATELLAEYSDRVDRRVGDFVTDPVEPHDVVVMHRVVCCYPDVDALVGAAASRTRQRLVLTVPQQRFWIRLGMAAANLWLRISRCGFRAYVHPFDRIVAAAEPHGLRLERRERHGAIWETALLGVFGARHNHCFAKDP